MKERIISLSTFLSRDILNKVFAVFSVLLLFISLAPHIMPHAHATGITVSNLTFDPSTGAIDFDYSGDTLTGPQDLYIYNTGGTTLYWESAKSGHCSTSHCFGALVPSTNSDTGVTAVIIQVGSVDQSQTLNYPLPLPTTNTPQTQSVGSWVSTGATWTYASANSFTISGDQTAIYTPGTRIKATNNSTTFYGTVTISSYSSGTTTVTLVANSDYSLSNSAITQTYYSYAANPQGYPGWFNYSATWGGFSSNPTSVLSRFSVVGNTAIVVISCGGGGTSNSTSTTVSLPVGAQQQVNVAGAIDVYDNGSHKNLGVASTNAGSTTLTLYTSGFGSWTASGSKCSNFTLSYEY